MDHMQVARERSVGNLQRLYTVVVSLAIAEGLRRLVSAIEQNGIIDAYGNLLMFLSFVATVIPFYHGANRYLDATYVTGERRPKRYTLLIDFVALFIEGLLLFVLAMLSNKLVLFYTLLAGLFVFDAIWVAFTKLTTEEQEDHGPKYIKWAALNIGAAAALSVFAWSNILNWEFWSTPDVKNIALFIVALARTVYDYMSVWSFYYPRDEEEEYNDIPAPRPAPPPSRYRRQVTRTYE
jgi:hypothetical protein